VGTVNKVQNEAQVTSASGAITAAVVHMKDELRTGANARLQVTFRDNTLLTLGEHASVVIDRYVYDPDRSVGETALQAIKGAFRFATNRIKEMKDHKIAVSTPVADIGVRGTEFWGGPLGKYGVLLLEGEVIVSNQAGSFVLAKSGQGTDIASALDPPVEPKAWPEEKVARAPPSPCTDRWE
jgi:hypothetical protein